MLSADIISDFGDTVYDLALMNYVLLLKDSELAIAIITFIGTVPLMSAIIFGYIADHIKRKINGIILTQFIRLIAYILVGIVMSFPPALWIVIFTAFIGLISDFLGQFENSLYTPLSLRIISNQDRAEASAFSSSIHSASSIIFRFSGALFIGILSYSQLAYLNASTFMICIIAMLLVRPTILKLLKTNPIKENKDHLLDGNHSFISSFKNSIRFVFKEMVKVPEIKINLIIIPILNGLFSALSVLVTLLSKNDSHFIIFSIPFTIALPVITLMLGQICGNILLMTGLKNLSYFFLTKMAVLSITFILLSLLFHNAYLLSFFLFVSGIFVGLINPKFFAIIMNSMPEDKIALINSGIQTIFTLGIVLGNIILSGLVFFLPVDIIIYIYLFMSFVLVAYTLKKLGIKGGFFDEISN